VRCDFTASDGNKVLPSVPCDFTGAFRALPYMLQQTAVEAYQSWLWNAVARETVPRDGAIVADDPHGALVFPAPTRVSAALRALRLPHPSPETVPSRPWGEAMARVLADEGVALADLQIRGARRPRFGVAPRPLFVHARGYRAGAVAPDESGDGLKRTLAFSLPRGAYATVLLRALGQ
jgi:tRNA pseudouridine13 synthase